MNKILISIKPEWAELILNKEKTIELRKNIPACKLPCEVYIYVTKCKPILLKFNWQDQTWYEDFNSFDEVSLDQCHAIASDVLNGKILAKFTLNKVDRFTVPNVSKWFEKETLDEFNELVSKSKVAILGLSTYFKNKPGYAWHIEDLETFDKPKELSDFGLNRAPQSWCYLKN